VEVEFADDDLERLYSDPSFSLGLSVALVRAYRKVVGLIHSVRDERDLRAIKSFHFEKLRGERSHQHSLRLNNQYRLIIELTGKGAAKIVIIIDIVDYH